MKKAILLSFIISVMLFAISGCGSKNDFDFLIENHNWQFSNMVDSKNGTIVACSEEIAEANPEAKIMALTCKAGTNVMAIRDAATGNGKEISYSGIAKDTNSLTYKLVFQDGDETIEGMAVSSITEYAKGKYEYTLVVDLDGYALYFYEKIAE